MSCSVKIHDLPEFSLTHNRMTSINVLKLRSSCNDENNQLITSQMHVCILMSAKQQIDFSQGWTNKQIIIKHVQRDL